MVFSLEGNEEQKLKLNIAYAQVLALLRDTATLLVNRHKLFLDDAKDTKEKVLLQRVRDAVTASRLKDAITNEENYHKLEDVVIDVSEYHLKLKELQTQFVDIQEKVDRLKSECSYVSEVVALLEDTLEVKAYVRKTTQEQIKKALVLFELELQEKSARIGHQVNHNNEFTLFQRSFR